MPSRTHNRTNNKSIWSKFKKNVGWIVSLLTIVSMLFGAGMWIQNIIDKAELHEINAQHYNELVTLKQSYFFDKVRLENENHDLKRKLKTFKSSSKEVTNE